MTQQEKFWEATKEQHEAGQKLIRKVEWLQQWASGGSMYRLPDYVRAEIAEIVKLAREAAI